MNAENRISEQVLKAAFNIHKSLGPGLLSNTYVQCLAYELKQLGLEISSSKEMPLVYGDLKVRLGYRLDLIVGNRVLIQVIDSDASPELNMAKMKTYLKVSGCKVGFLMNFDVLSLKQGIRRILNNYEASVQDVRNAS